MTRTLILASTLWPAPCWPPARMRSGPIQRHRRVACPNCWVSHQANSIIHSKKELYILNQHDQEALRRVCRLDRPLLGCVIYVDAQKCVIAVADKETITRFHSYEATLRHEVAHCNGWRH